MPVRSLASSVLKWPDKATVIAALRPWAAKMAIEQPKLRKVGYFGSYARGDWGVGSDLDLVVVVANSATPFMDRPSQWDRSSLPVPTDILVYTVLEWQDVVARGDRFSHVMTTEVDWVLD